MMANGKKINSEAKQSQVHVDKAVPKPVYTINEFAAAPAEIGDYSTDIIKAALIKGGKESYTVEEAKAVVERFAEKEVH